MKKDQTDQNDLSVHVQRDRSILNQLNSSQKQRISFWNLALLFLITFSLICSPARLQANLNRAHDTHKHLGTKVLISIAAWL